MPTPIRLDGVLAKIEGTYATDSVPVVGTDTVRIVDRLWPQLQERFAWPNERTAVASGSLIPPIPGVAKGRYCTIDFGWEIKGSRSGGAYSAGNKIEASPLLQACVCSEALVTTGGSESLTYQHADTNHSSCTIYAYAGGYLYKLVGCRGTWHWPINVGVHGVLMFHLEGILASKTVAAYPGGFVYATPGPVPGVAMALSVGGVWTPDVVTADFLAQGTTSVQRLDSGNAADGIQSFDIGDTVQPLFKIQAKAVIAAYDPSADLVANPRTVRTLALVYNTAVQYDRAKLNVTNMYITDPIRNLNQSGFAAWDLTYLCDASWALKFD